MNRKFGVVLSLVCAIAGNSAAMAGSSDDEAQRAIDRIVNEGAAVEPVFPVAESVPEKQSDRTNDIDVQKHIDQVVEQGAAEAFAS